ncbi:hypothetical protein ACHQM5_006707 [Ranunculus cassubicifolius]
MPKGQFQNGIFSGRRTLGRCNKGKAKNVVCLDDEDGKSEEYIFIDAPEFLQESLHGSNLSLKKSPTSIFINIDDDEDNVDESKNCDKVRRDQECGGTSTKASCPSSRGSKSVKKANIFDNIGRTRAKRSPVTFSKSKRTYSGKACFTRIGLDAAYDSSSSDSDNSDCEILEGSSGNIREQWEKAALKRKMTEGVQNGHSVSHNQASGSGIFKDIPNNVEGENNTSEHVAAPFCTTSNNNVVEDCNLPTSNPTSSGNNVAGDPDFDVELDKGGDQDGPSVCEKPPQEEAHISQEKADIHERGKTSLDEHYGDIDHDELYTLLKETEIPLGHLFGENVCFQEEAKTVPEEVLWANYGSCFATDIPEEATHQDEEVLWANTERSDGTDANFDSHISPDMNKMNDSGSCFSNVPVEKAESDLPQDAENQNGYMQHESEGSCSDNEKKSALGSDDKTQQEAEKSALHAGDFDGANAHEAENTIIVDRETFKETEDYKRAAEEEWASRQHQLQLQAEEAQKLKKRKRAETQRIVDVERRQRERLEEMRETQKKNTETINMKEQLRAQIRKELVRLELIHTDMISLLRALGIPVGTGFCPTTQEVNAAYKKALLKFHPDRASKTDIQLQVEAEEKFKLISRLKEKLTNSTHRLF